MPKSTDTPWTEGPLHVSCTRRTMDGQQWLRICSQDGFERAYVPFGDRTVDEYVQCMSDAKLYAAAPLMAELLKEWSERSTLGGFSTKTKTRALLSHITPRKEAT